MSDSGHAAALQRGASILVVVGGEPREVEVERVTDGLIWVSTRALGAVQPGEDVEVEIGVRGDARYRGVARVAIAMRDTVSLRLQGDWARRQGREYVRVNTYGLRAEIEPQDDSDTRLAELPLIDFSAGGARVAEPEHLHEGDVVKCHFPLGDVDFKLVARVVRVSPESAGSRRFVSLEFQGVSEGVRSDLTSWVAAEQRRRVNELRERSQGSRSA